MPKILAALMLILSFLMLMALSIGGLLLAPELHRSAAEAGIQAIATDEDPSKSGEVLNQLVRQITTPPTLPERLMSRIVAKPVAWPREGIAALADIVVASIVIGPGEASLRLSEQLPHLVKILPPQAFSGSSGDIRKDTENLRLALNDHAHMIREEQLIAKEVVGFEGSCRLLRTDLARLLDLGDQSADGSPCQSYQSGPLVGLPRLKPLRAEPSTTLELTQLLRAAGSTIDPMDSQTIRRITPRLSDIQAAVRELLPKITSATKRLTDNQAAQRKLSSATFVQQEHFIASLLLTLHDARSLPIHRKYHRLYTHLGAVAVRLVANEPSRSDHQSSVN